MAMKESYYTVDDQMLGYKGASGRKDFLRDNLGSVTAEIDQTGMNRTFDGRYKPYGNLLWSTGTPGKFGWIGSWGYRSTGLKASTQYVRARHYSYISGSWTTTDPLWPRQLAYLYTSQNPVRKIDVFGTWPVDFNIFKQIDRACPIAPTSLPLCSQSPYGRGNCPNQSRETSGPIDLNRFDKIGDPTSPLQCDPNNADKAAITARINVLNKLVADRALCTTPGDTSLPLGSAYAPYAITAPCRERMGIFPEGSRFRLSCAIRCKDVYMGELKESFKGRPLNGIGCLACCLVRHENKHCAQVIAGHPALGTYGSECEAFQSDIQCLTRILEGKKCSAS